MDDSTAQCNGVLGNSLIICLKVWISGRERWIKLSIYQLELSESFDVSRADVYHMQETHNAIVFMIPVEIPRSLDQSSIFFQEGIID